MIEIIIETVSNVVNSVNPMVWVGGGVFLMAIAYVVWLIRGRF